MVEPLTREVVANRLLKVAKELYSDPDFDGLVGDLTATVLWLREDAKKHTKPENIKPTKQASDAASDLMASADSIAEIPNHDFGPGDVVKICDAIRVLNNKFVRSGMIQSSFQTNDSFPFNQKG